MQLKVILIALAALPIIVLGADEEGYAGQKGFEFRKQQLARLQPSPAVTEEPIHPVVDVRKPTPPFYTDKSKKFYVDGKKIPDVDWDAGPSYAGLMPISGDKNETRKLFFWFWPTTNQTYTDDLIFWTNGGPGCSSLEGFLQENGPIQWTWGQAYPSPNPYPWTNLSHVLWVEQPVGTGFTQGTPNITTDDELAEQFVGFMGQFLETFADLKGKNFYATGESYAGYYVPYIANYIYNHPGVLDIALKGIWIADPSLSYGIVQEQIPALRFAQANANVFPFTNATWATLQNMSDSCGYTDYLDKYVTYPPQGLLPLPHNTSRVTRDCDIWDTIIDEVYNLNPAFNVYRVTETWPQPWSVLGFPELTQEFVYFNRTDVQKAINAPHINWDICSDIRVYGGTGRDQSTPSMLSVMPNVIEHSERVVVVHGLADMILLAEGTRIAIQNMTWGGQQGFQSPIEPETFTVPGFGVYGNAHTERNLTYVEFYYSGHMTPQFVPWAAYQTVEYLLGRRESP